MIDYTLYDKTSGEIVAIGMAATLSLVELQDNDTTGVTLGTLNHETQYVLNDIPTLRPPLSLVTNKATINADGLDEWVVTGIPVGALVTDPTGVTSTVNDGEIVFSVDTPDTYVFTIKAFPYLDTEISIEATA